jgi:hypothetical protein
MTTILCWIILDGGTQSVQVKIGRDKDVTALCQEIIKSDEIRNTCHQIDWGNVVVSKLFLSKDRLKIGKERKIRDLPENTRCSPINVDIGAAKNILTSGLHRRAASHAISTSEALEGYGSLPSSFRFDATDKSAVFSLLCPTDEDISNVEEDMPLAGELMHMSSRGEGGTGGVNHIFKSSRSLFHAITIGGKKLNHHKLGLATAASYCDHLMMKNGEYYGVVELKGGQYSPFFGSRQSAAYSTHFAMELLRLGVPRERVIVPSHTYTGMQIQFGVTIVLAPSFPVFRTISKVLDMGDMHERQMAVAYVQKATSWIKKLSSEHRAPVVPVTAMELNLNAYHIQKITREYAMKGFLLFAEGEGGVSQGVEHWGRVLNILYSVKMIRPFIAFPLAIRSANLPNGDDIIIYEDYYAMGYRNGCPDRTGEKNMYVAYRTELTRIMEVVHKAGVIHCDLCLSNIMWKKAGSNVSIIITGWERAHCLMEGRFHSKVQAALNIRIGAGMGPAVFSEKFDHQCMQVLGM